MFTKAFVCFGKRARINVYMLWGCVGGSSNLQLRYKAKHMRLCKSFIILHIYMYCI